MQNFLFVVLQEVTKTGSFFFLLLLHVHEATALALFRLLRNRFDGLEHRVFRQRLAEIAFGRGNRLRFGGPVPTLVFSLQFRFLPFAT